MNAGLKATQAAKAMLEDADPALTTITNFEAEVEDPNEGDNNNAITSSHPCVRIWASGAQEYPPLSGNYNVELNVMIEVFAARHNAAQVEAMFDEVWAIFSTTTFAADLSAAIDGFHCFGLTGGIQQSSQTSDEDFRRKVMTIPINCCATDIS